MLDMMYVLHEWLALTRCSLDRAHETRAGAMSKQAGITNYQGTVPEGTNAARRTAQTWKASCRALASEGSTARCLSYRAVMTSDQLAAGDSSSLPAEQAAGFHHTRKP